MLADNFYPLPLGFCQAEVCTKRRKHGKETWLTPKGKEKYLSDA